MARPMTAEETVRALRTWHVPFKAVEGWRTRNRNHRGSWGPVHGLMIHHTGDDAPDDTDLQVILRGRSDLPGPLAQFGCDDDGTIWLIGCGRANHAGGGDPRVLSAVIEESYAARPPRPHEHTGSSRSTDGNDNFYGVETFYSGRRPPTSAARRSLVLLAAAVCHHHGWTAKSVIGHREWSDWKSDPGHMDMDEFRKSVAHRLHEGPPDEVTGPERHLARARSNLESAHQDLLVARRNLTRAIKEGADVRPIRRRVTEAAPILEQDAASLRKQQL